MLKEQPADCDPEGEPYAPTTVDIVLDNPEVALRQLGHENPVVTRAPGAADLFGLGEGFFLDFPGSSLSPGCIYEPPDFRKYSADVPATVYAHVVQQPDEPDRVFVQYWFYWSYNRLEQQTRVTGRDHPPVRRLLDRRGLDDRARRGRNLAARGWRTSRVGRPQTRTGRRSTGGLLVAGSHASYLSRPSTSGTPPARDSVATTHRARRPVSIPRSSSSRTRSTIRTIPSPGSTTRADGVNGKAARSTGRPARR